jgi:hypothetical protein
MCYPIAPLVVPGYNLALCPIVLEEFSYPALH